MSSPTSRPEYGLYESPTNAKAGPNGTTSSGSPNGQSPTSQTRGLISDKELYSPRAKPGGGRSRHSRKVFVAAVIFLAAVCGIVAHSHSKHNNAKAQQGGGIRPSRSQSKSPASPAPITSMSNDEDNSSDENISKDSTASAEQPAAPAEKLPAEKQPAPSIPQQTTPITSWQGEEMLTPTGSRKFWSPAQNALHNYLHYLTHRYSSYFYLKRSQMKKIPPRLGQVQSQGR